MTFSEPVSQSEPLLKSLYLLKFNDIIHSEILSFVYQWFHKLIPSCFLDFFKLISSIHDYPTCQSLNENFNIYKINSKIELPNVAFTRFITLVPTSGTQYQILLSR